MRSRSILKKPGTRPGATSSLPSGFLLLATLAVALGLTWGCGKYVAKPQARGEQLLGDTPGGEPSEAPLDKIRVSCPRGTCSSSIAMILAPAGDRPQAALQTCTGFLVAEDLLATSAECLPRSLRVAGTSCRGIVQTFFMKTPANPSGQVDCSQIVSVSAPAPGDRVETSVSFAFLRLAHPVRAEILELSDEGFHPDESYRSLRIQTPSNQSYQGQIQTVQCRALQGSMALPEYTQDTSPQVSLRDCSLEANTRGSPLLDDVGKVRGILHSAPSNQKMAPLEKLILKGTRRPIVFASNAACIRVPGKNSARPFPAGCQTSVSESADSVDVMQEANGALARMEQQSQVQLKALLGVWATQHDRLQWKLDYNAATLEYYPVPVCFNPVGNWISQYKKATFGYQRDAREAVQSLSWSISVGLNSYMQPTLDIDEEIQSGLMDFSPVEIWKKRRTQAAFRIIQEDRTRTVFDGVLEICPESDSGR